MYIIMCKMYLQGDALRESLLVRYLNGGGVTMTGSDSDSGIEGESGDSVSDDFEAAVSTMTDKSMDDEDHDSTTSAKAESSATANFERRDSLLSAGSKHQQQMPPSTGNKSSTAAAAKWSPPPPISFRPEQQHQQQQHKVTHGPGGIMWFSLFLENPTHVLFSG